MTDQVTVTATRVAAITAPTVAPTGAIRRSHIVGDCGLYTLRHYGNDSVWVDTPVATPDDVDYADDVVSLGLFHNYRSAVDAVNTFDGSEPAQAWLEAVSEARLA